MKTLVEMLQTVARENANRLAVVHAGEGVGYNTLETGIVSLARDLQGFGFRKGDRVALLLPNGLDFVVSYFAVVILGAVVVPLNDHYQQNELRYFFRLGEVIERSHFIRNTGLRRFETIHLFLHCSC